MPYDWKRSRVSDVALAIPYIRHRFKWFIDLRDHVLYTPIRRMALFYRELHYLVTERTALVNKQLGSSREIALPNSLIA